MPFPFEYIPFQNKNVEEKVNYFFAYIQLYNSKLGMTSEFEFETFHSLLSKIQYQLKYNDVQDFWIGFVLNHLGNKLLLNYLDELIDANEKYISLKNTIIALESEKDKKKCLVKKKMNYQVL